MPRSTLLIIAACIVFFFAILMCFGIVVDVAEPNEISGAFILGSLLFAAAHLP